MNYHVNAGAVQGPEGVNNDLQADNPWAMLLQTFLPWVNIGQVPDYSQQEDPSGPNSTASPENEAQQAADREADREEDDLD